ncbi:MAG: sulfurtransferase TusA family protein [Promethearchaeota archaeon]|jgi:TusA-related sulfurtransferase
MSRSQIKLEKIDERLYQLDVRGLVCPFPQVMVTRALEDLEEEEVLEVIIDNPPSVRDIPPALAKKGYTSDIVKVDKITSKIVIQSKKE